MSNKETSFNTAQAIFKLLFSLKGFRDWWASIEPDVQIEIVQKIEDVINEA